MENENGSFDLGLDKYLSEGTDANQEAPEATNTTTDSTKEASPSDGTLDTNVPEQTDKGEESVLDKIEKMKDEGTPQATSLLDLVSKLDLSRNGIPQKYETEEQVKEALSKWKDYEASKGEVNKEKEAVAKERTEFTEKVKAFEAKEAELSNKLIEYDLFEEALLDMKTNEPELLEIVMKYYQQKESAYHQASKNPEVQRLKASHSELEKKIESILKAEKEAKMEKIRSGWSEELASLQASYGAKFKSLGIVPDWKAVEAQWVSDVNGKLSGKAALMATHGEMLEKAWGAKEKLLTTQAKSNLRKGPDNTKTNNNTKPKPQEDSLMSFLEKAAEKYA